MTNTQNNVKSEIRVAIEETRNRIKAKMFGHGMIKAVSEKSGISKYRIRQAITGKNPDIETLEQIEKAISKLSKSAA